MVIRGSNINHMVHQLQLVGTGCDYCISEGCGLLSISCDGFNGSGYGEVQAMWLLR